MKKRNGMRTAALLVAAAVMVSTGTTSFAAGTTYSATIGTEDNVEKYTTIDKYLVMDDSATVPNATFTYTVEAGGEKTYTKTTTTTKDDGTTIDTTTTTEVKAGINAAGVTVSAGTGTETGDVVADTTTTDVNDYKLSFDSEDTTASNSYNGSLTTFDDDTQKYAKKTLQIDFSACIFPEPGIYRYKLTESGTNQGISNDMNTVRYIDVYVVDATTTENGTETKKLNIAGYQVYTGEATLYDGSTVSGSTPSGSTTSGNGNKSSSFTNTYDTADLTFRKEVSGNQASKDKYFKFTVKIETSVQNTKYTVDITKADGTPSKTTATTYTTMTNTVSELTANTYDKATGKYYVTQDFYLMHGQEITIKGLEGCSLLEYLDISGWNLGGSGGTKLVNQNQLKELQTLIMKKCTFGNIQNGASCIIKT